jgi:FecR protein
VTSPNEPQERDMTTHDQIGQLLRLAGRRPMPDPGDMRRARAAAHAEWTLVVQQRARGLRWRSLIVSAIAAAACAAAAWAWLRPPSVAVPASEIATIERITGTIAVTSQDSTSRPVRDAGVRLRAGDRIEVPDDSRAAFVLAQGIAVRLDRGTAAVLQAVDRLTLQRGTIYIDSGTVSRGPGLRIETTMGAVQHLGTRFEVRVTEASLRVRVREGSVALERRGARWTAAAGEALTIANGQAPVRQHIASAGPEWAWIAELAEPFTLESATVQAFLEWVRREQGSRWQIDDPAVRARANRIVLHGSIEGLTPEEALEAVLPAAGLTFRRDGDRIVITHAR